MARRKKPPIASGDEVLAMFTAIMRGEISERQVKTSPKGEEITESTAKVSERSHAAELLSKQFGLFADSGDDACIDSGTAEEIDQLAQRMLAKEGGA